MILCIDIGNSNIVIAIYKDDHWAHTFRYETKDVQGEFYYERALRNLLFEWRILPSKVQQSVISSVVPDYNDIIKDAVYHVTGIQPLILAHDVFEMLDMNVPHPYEIGSDIVSNAYGAIKTYHDKCIIVDFGTALTFVIVDEMTGIKGVTIAPGLKTAIQSLSSQTAQLPVVPLELPSSSIGKDTVSAIQSGVLWGYVGLVRQLLSNIKVELADEEYQVIATGGLSSILIPLHSEFDHVDKMLTVNGMRLIYNFMKLKKSEE